MFTYCGEKRDNHNINIIMNFVRKLDEECIAFHSTNQPYIMRALLAKPMDCSNEKNRYIEL